MLQTIQDASDETLEWLANEKALRKTRSFVLVLTLGGQFDHLISLKIAQLGIFAQVADPSKLTAADVKRLAPQGIILSGGPASVHAEQVPFDREILDLGIPTLGICLGCQVIAQHCGMTVKTGAHGEFHPTDLILRRFDRSIPLLDGFFNGSVVLQSHADQILEDTTDFDFECLASTAHAPVSVASWRGHLYGVQFHPEVSDTAQGGLLFKNFCVDICGIADRFPAEDEAQQKIVALRQQIGDKKVLVALSGGSDSSVVMHLLECALGADAARQITAVYIEGIDRPDDKADCMQHFGNRGWPLKVVDATDKYLAVLEGVTGGKQKRIAMRTVYQEILEQEVRAFGAAFIAQGTLYTDLVESGLGHATGARRAQIKQHHNTGLEFSVPELVPLADCVKDTARAIGRTIGVPGKLLQRHPFPGPGLVVRVEGEITSGRLELARQLDRILIEEIRAAGLYEQVWQAGACVLNSFHTTNKGDDAGRGYNVMYFAVSSVNGFTARPCNLPFELHTHIANRMGNEVPAVGSVSYRVSGKPFSTIEME